MPPEISCKSFLSLFLLKAESPSLTNCSRLSMSFVADCLLIKKAYTYTLLTVRFPKSGMQ
jgi:hypothetical protein